jgi:tetratricopeptide (TPR) repeat protein
MRNFFLSLLFILFFAAASRAQDQKKYLFSKKTIISWNDTTSMSFVKDPSMYSDGWDTLPQTQFWRDVISMTSDTCIINIAYCRKPVNKVNRLIWMNQTEPEKLCFKDSVCKVNGLDSLTNLYVTAGKGEFYEVKKVLPDINKAISIFQKNNCDPWYAQAILLIESPGKSKSKSYVGANGPFQLMRSVAIKYGLHVNSRVDDRTDIQKSAAAAAKLINVACIPYIKKFLDAHSVAYSETDLWFRLLVLHAYHAGAGNVSCVIDEINPSEGGVELFKKIWQTTCRGFKNESQNYSQIALASLLNFDQLINRDGDTLWLVRGDRMMHKYRRKNLKATDSYELLNRCMSEYENDFIDDMIPFEYFMKRISYIRKEFAYIAKAVTLSDKEIVLKKYPSSEEHLSMLAANLTKRQRYEDAIRLLKFNLDIYPESVSSYDSIAKLYRLTGDKKNADFYSSRAGTMAKETGKNTD